MLYTCESEIFADIIRVSLRNYQKFHVDSYIVQESYKNRNFAAW